MGNVDPLTFPEAREIVLRLVHATPMAESVGLDAAAGRVLAEDIAADREMPALARSVRDGFAVRASDIPGELTVIGEVRAGDQFGGTVGPGQAVEIMTGAPVPAGANAVVMVEHTTRSGDRVTTDRGAEPGQFINPRGCEAAAGDVMLRKGTRLDYTGVALLAAVGRPEVKVFRKPSVAIIATGDEIVEPHETPRDYQIRNSNAWSVAVQVTRAGGIPTILPIARDTLDATRTLIEQGLTHDLLLLSGGVSAGKHDVVEPALAAVGAEFFFDRVLIQPGQPLVFGRARDRFFFGLPGNPASTMVTFEIFARAAVERLGGQECPELLMPQARLTREFRHRPGLTRFLPSRLTGDTVTPIGWSGSGDIASLTRANAFLVAEPDRPVYAAGEWIRVLSK
jgi:molybdopterin molybdotransferase